MDCEEKSHHCIGEGKHLWSLYYVSTCLDVNAKKISKHDHNRNRDEKCKLQGVKHADLKTYMKSTHGFKT